MKKLSHIISISLLSLVLILAGGQSVYADIGDISTRDYETLLEEARTNEELARAYTRFADTQNEQNAAALTRALENTGLTLDEDITKDTTIETLPFQAVTTLNERVLGAEGNFDTPLPDTDSDEFKAALENLQNTVDQRTTELQILIRDENSAKIAQDNTDDEERASMAQTVRSFQDLEDMRRLGCFENVPEGQSRSSLCDQLVSQYNNSNAEDEADLTVGSTEGVSNARANLQTQISTIESRIQQQQQDALARQTLNVNEVLSLRVGEDEQRSFISSGGIVYFISRVVDSLTITVTSLAVVILIIGGYMFIFSAGDEQKRENGKDIIKYTIIGLVITFSAYSIVALIRGLIS